MVEIKTHIEKDEIVKNNPVLRKTTRINFIAGGIVLFMSIISLIFIREELFTSILFLVLGIFFIALGIITPILTKRNKLTPEYIEYDYKLTDENILVNIKTVNATSEVIVEYTDITKYKKYNDFHFVFVNKYIYYMVKDSDINEVDKEYFLSKVNKKHKK